MRKSILLPCVFLLFGIHSLKSQIPVKQQAAVQTLLLEFSPGQLQKNYQQLKLWTSTVHGISVHDVCLQRNFIFFSINAGNEDVLFDKLHQLQMVYVIKKVDGEVRLNGCDEIKSGE